MNEQEYKKSLEIEKCLTELFRVNSRPVVIKQKAKPYKIVFPLVIQLLLYDMDVKTMDKNELKELILQKTKEQFDSKIKDQNNE
jgi:hypothetical protein